SKMSRFKNAFRIRVDLTWEDVPGMQNVHELITPRLQILNRKAGPAVDAPIRVVKRAEGKVTFVSSIPDVLLFSAMAKNSSPIHDLFVIVTANNVAEKVKVEP